MILTHGQEVTEWYFFFSYSSNGASKNEFVSQFTCLQPHFYLKYERWIYNKQVQCSNGPQVLGLTSQTSQTDWPKVFCGITQNSMIFFVPSMEAKNQLDTSYSFQVF